MDSAAGERFGFKADAWERGKREAICAIVRAGRMGAPIFYSDLARQITTIAIEPHSYAMDYLPDEISKEEDAAGRGISTALVVLREEGYRRTAFGFQPRVSAETLKTD